MVKLRAQITFCFGQGLAAGTTTPGPPHTWKVLTPPLATKNNLMPASLKMRGQKWDLLIGWA